MHILGSLFVSFMLIGLGSYGGGLVTIPLIQHELVASRQWLSFTEMAWIVSVAQMTPGPIAINTATFTGLRLNGILGAAAATTAVVMPSIFILSLAAPWADRLRNNIYARRLAQGIKVGALSLILYAVWSYGSAAVKGWAELAVAAAAFTLLAAFEQKLHPVFVILACGAAGLFIF